MAMVVSLRIKSGLTPARTSRRRVSPAAYLTPVVPPNVQEARSWIAAWKARQVPALEQPQKQTATEVPPNVLEARGWIATWKARQVPASAEAPEVPVPQTATPEVPPPAQAATAEAAPSNVLEARAWIAAWKGRQVPVVQASKAVDGMASDAVALEPAPPADDAPVSSSIPPSSNSPGPALAADGTLTFRKSLLDSMTYEDLLQALAAKVKRELP